MALNYGWVDPKEFEAFQLIEPGEGSFKIVKAEEKFSRAGNPMMVVTFRLTDCKGRDTLHNEYLVTGTDPVQIKSTATKIYNLLQGIGRTSSYGKPLEPRDIVGATGKCIIKTQKSEDPQYSDKSVISRYIIDAPQHSQSSDMEDDIPF